MGSCVIITKRRRDSTRKVQSRTLILRTAIGRSRKPKPLSHLLSQLRRLAQARGAMNYKFFRRSNFLTFRLTDEQKKKGDQLLGMGMM